MTIPAGATIMEQPARILSRVCDTAMLSSEPPMAPAARPFERHRKPSGLTVALA